MKRFIIILLVLSSIFLISCDNVNESTSNENENHLKVYTSFYTLYDFASKIGGEHAEVINMIPEGGGPHHWEPTASDIINLEKADIFIYNGLALEHWVENVLDALSNEDLIIVEASDGIDTLEHSNGNHDNHGHSHGDTDPHIWLDPLKAKSMLESIKDAFVSADPNNKDYYEANYSHYAKMLDELDSEYKESFKTLSSRDIVVSHAAFTYLSNAYDLNQVAIEGLVPESEPNPNRMAEIIDYIKDNKIEAIFYEDVNNSKIAETISKETGVNIEILYTLEYLTDEQRANKADYFSVMRENLQSLKSGLK